ncbi:hypothetical protein [Salirhabdus salicampi]|uniref:hypothetical protein n=1 Tax=Salirhabdus salicampi TaxID=476102 RepID=UPI0020C5614F|nr:hypothetical protein [Salirhabdus salicampi]MCP8615406.1 hypothetical protein [Salirhabdus salicampi]
MGYHDYWDKIIGISNELSSVNVSYWSQYSHMGTWQFWVILGLMICPLILLFFTVDRFRIFEIFFFGFIVHLLWAYIDIALTRETYLIHTYFIIPLFPFALSVTASALPVGFILLYQYCTNRNKNFYLHTIWLSVMFAYVFASFEEILGLLELRKGLLKYHLFLIDIAVAYIAFLATKLILKLKQRETNK